MFFNWRLIELISPTRGFRGRVFDSRFVENVAAAGRGAAEAVRGIDVPSLSDVPRVPQSGGSRPERQSTKSRNYFFRIDGNGCRVLALSNVLHSTCGPPRSGEPAELPGIAAPARPRLARCDRASADWTTRRRHRSSDVLKRSGQYLKDTSWRKNILFFNDLYGAIE